MVSINQNGIIHSSHGTASTFAVHCILVLGFCAAPSVCPNTAPCPPQHRPNTAPCPPQCRSMSAPYPPHVRPNTAPSLLHIRQNAAPCPPHGADTNLHKVQRSTTAPKPPHHRPTAAPSPPRNGVVFWRSAPKLPHSYPMFLKHPPQSRPNAARILLRCGMGELSSAVHKLLFPFSIDKLMMQVIMTIYSRIT